MTATAFVPSTPWLMPETSGSSIRLSRSLPGHLPLTLTVVEPQGSLPGLWNSTGVSTGAEAMERSVRQLWVEFRQRLATYSPIRVDIEREVIVLLPPKRQRTVTVHVHHAGRAKPLINLDDILIEPDGD